MFILYYSVLNADGKVAAVGHRPTIVSPLGHLRCWENCIF